MSEATNARQGLVTQVTELDSRFWIVNTMEMVERFAYYGVRAVVALYMVLPVELGGPEFTHVQKGSIFACWAALQSFLPMFTGGLADRYGHKRTISLAIVLKIIGYIFMALFTSYWGFWAGCMLLATGTAIFKPGVQGTLAATMRESSASVGWAIFYQLVNIGGFLGPVLAGALRTSVSWAAVFWACAVLVAVNFMWLPFYKDPTQEPGYQAEDRQKEVWRQVSLVITRPLAQGWLHGLCAASIAGFAIIAIGSGMAADVWTLPADSEALEGMWTLGRIQTIAWTGLILSAVGWALSFTPKSAPFAWIPMVATGGLAVFAWLAEWHLFYQARLPEAWPAPEGVLDAAPPIPTLASMPFAFFYLVTASTVLAFFFLYYLPRKEQYDAGLADGWSVVIVSAVGVFQHRVLWFCVAFSGFWFMFNQVFDLLPNVIDDWVDSSMIIGALGKGFGTGTLPWSLAVFFAIVIAFVCGAVVLLATRPDRRPASEVPEEAYTIVLMSYFAVGMLMPHMGSSIWIAPGMQADLGAGVGLIQAGLFASVVAIAAWKLQLDGKLLALGAFVLALPFAIYKIGTTLMASSEGLVKMAEEGAQIPPEWMINLNPGLIVFTVVFFGYLSSFVRPLTSILIGMLVATVGSYYAGTSIIGWSCLAGILIFSVGEMLSSPKKMEYLASLAKKGQEGLFMGYANVPVAIGWITGSIFAGNFYEKNGDKVNLARRHLVKVLEENEATVAAMEKSKVVPHLAEQLGIDEAGVRTLLFEQYHPQHIWIWIAGIGVASIALMVIYDRVLRMIDNKKAA